MKPLTVVETMGRSHLPWGQTPIMIVWTDRFGPVTVYRAPTGQWRFEQQTQITPDEHAAFNKACDIEWERP